ncbi:MAG: TetR/AcrR family transcriptional regulator [Spirochaetaceae bacterium]|nr:MAG: TetR/AcrR family transcriptional regulator [Spirochaetaceae bacterium]
MTREDPLTPQERVAKEHEALRERILDAAEEILVEGHGERLSVRAIARRISYAPASLYYHFADRDAIIAGVLGRGARRIGAAIGAAAGAERTSVGALRAAFRAYIRVATERPALALVVYSMKRPLSTNLARGATGRNPNLAALAALVERAREEGQISVDDVDLAVRCVWTAAQGLVIRLALDQDVSESDKTEVIDAYVDLVMNGLRAGGTEWEANKDRPGRARAVGSPTERNGGGGTRRSGPRS